MRTRWIPVGRSIEDPHRRDISTSRALERETTAAPYSTNLGDLISSLTNTSPSLEDRQDYHTDNSTESGSLAQDRLENNSPDPLQSSDPSRSYHVLYSDIDLSNAHFSDNFRPSEESDDPLPAQSSSPDVNPSNEWGGFDNDSKMSSPPPHQDHSPQEDSGTFDQS